MATPKVIIHRLHTPCLPASTQHRAWTSAILRTAAVLAACAAVLTLTISL